MTQIEMDDIISSKIEENQKTNKEIRITYYEI